ncbi:hypothetical protein WICPIJ_000342 [Wickerhamomyces pijperi]|uniref:Transmembrane protein n=1 Tax=Wickerhamomyces pijperi TaxID=599730 RepID=A0A9P8TRX5_WICPI|nr:hypothetical protein WICPIJ_000342 [Wickerhamomyces pijperi]
MVSGNVAVFVSMEGNSVDSTGFVFGSRFLRDLLPLLLLMMLAVVNLAEEPGSEEDPEDGVESVLDPVAFVVDIVLMDDGLWAWLVAPLLSTTDGGGLGMILSCVVVFLFIFLQFNIKDVGQSFS